jgi:hypothetical protein
MNALGLDGGRQTIGRQTSKTRHHEKHFISLAMLSLLLQQDTVVCAYGGLINEDIAPQGVGHEGVHTHHSRTCIETEPSEVGVGDERGTARTMLKGAVGTASMRGLHNRKLGRQP